jgi:single-strand DNA-binding protein
MATRSLNKVMLIGNLTRDPELRYTPQGTAVCTFGLATNRYWQPSDREERQEETEFHRIVAWQKLAELCAQLLFKGRKVFVEGRLQTRTWTGKDGQERTTTEIVIDNMIILDSKRREGEMGEGAGVPVPTASTSTKAAPTDTKAAAESKKRKVEKAEGEKSVSAKASTKASTDKEEVKADDIPF